MRDKKGTKNVVADHLFRLVISLRDEEECDLPIDNSFSDDHLFILSTPWFANLVNYLAYGIVPPDMNCNQKKRFFSQAKSYF